jgi:hypothetical protein
VDTPERLSGNLLGVGFGSKVSQRRQNQIGGESLRFYVAKKIPPGLLDEARGEAESVFTKTAGAVTQAQAGSAGGNAAWFVPPKIDAAVQTDVVEIGRARPFAGPFGPGSPILADSPRLRGAAMGAAGALVRDGEDKLGFITCNHVIAWNGWFPSGTAVTLMSFPGAEPTPLIGTYERCIPLRTDQPNLADCALAYLKPDVETTSVPARVTRAVSELAEPKLGGRVIKTGPVTGPTTGQIVDVDAEIVVDYEFGTYTLTQQIAIQSDDAGPFASDGDSGCLVFQDDGETQKPLAMIWGGGGSVVFASPLRSCLDLNPAVQLVLDAVPGQSAGY